MPETGTGSVVCPEKSTASFRHMRYNTTDDRITLLVMIDNDWNVR
ncbi:MAG: hypothetical protein ACUVSY_12765 [Roseiflexus sp.]